ncbi:mid region of cactin-domain-containing protein [Rhizophagus irregularis DAOM 181602=DAOM 197198]|nr:mid region of cactin-domain-containing protein [Rhizophagus irregularis DAOM 181602=DAOM 197198]
MSSHYPSYPRRYSPDNESRKHSRYSPDDEGRKRRNRYSDEEDRKRRYRYSDEEEDRKLRNRYSVEEDKRHRSRYSEEEGSRHRNRSSDEEQERKYRNEYSDEEDRRHRNRFSDEEDRRHRNRFSDEEDRRHRNRYSDEEDRRHHDRYSDEKDKRHRDRYSDEEDRRHRDRYSDEEDRRHRDRYSDEEDRRHRDRYSDEEERGRNRSSKRRYSSEEEKERKHRRSSEEGEGRRHHKSNEEEEERKRKKKSKKAKKESKKHKREHKADQFSYIDLSIYSNSDNPFNDANLGEKFEWTKKKDREKKLGLTPEEILRQEQQRREETQLELEKLKKRRVEREIEQQLRDEELSRMQREAEIASMGDWAAKEDEFHLQQAKRRAEIRIKESRAKPIDILAINLRLADENEDVDEALEIDIDEPYTIFENLNLQEVEELHQDIQKYLSLEKNPNNLDFWRAMIVVCDNKLSELQAEEKNLTGNVTAVVKDDINKLLAGKTYEQLNKLQSQIQQKLSGQEAVEVEYWEQQLKTITVWKAKAKLKAMHEIVLQKRLEQLRRKQRQEAIKVQEELETALASHSVQIKAEGQGTIDNDAIEEEDYSLIEEYDKLMSPRPFDKLPREDKQCEIVDLGEDMKSLREKRKEVLRNQFIPMKVQQKKPTVEEEEESLVSKVLYEREAAKDLDEDEAIFNIEEELAKTTYLWQDKYRPRKPRYFNRVHTGYEWNKYNQTHYDSDNPPPKVVQGYKFNIFYPDLIDKSKAPTYKIEREPGNNDTVLIRFMAGPPYEDIAFRIVNREWEYSHKKGFKSSFDRGVLQLHFHFKRHYYRR